MNAYAQEGGLTISFTEDSGHLDTRDTQRAAVLLDALATLIDQPGHEIVEMCRRPCRPFPPMTLAAITAGDPVAATTAAVDDFQRVRTLIPPLTGLMQQALRCTPGAYRPFLAMACLRRLLEFNPAFYAAFGDLQNLATRAGMAAPLTGVLDDATGRFPGLDTNLVAQVGIERWPAAAAQIDRGRTRGLPGILFNTMPKSGSMYISDRLARGLDVPAVPVAVASYTLRDHVVSAWAGRLRRGGAISQEHIDPSPWNLERLRRAGIERLVVHVRDPRQAMLSNLHHVARRYEEVAAFMEPVYPAAYPSWPLPDQAEWMIDNYFPELLDWVRGWVAIAEDRTAGLEVCFTRYEDLHSSEDRIIAQILDFHDIGQDLFDWYTKTERSDTTHFRRGMTDEWRDVFSPGQQARMWDQISRPIAERFGWRR